MQAESGEKVVEKHDSIDSSSLVSETAGGHGEHISIPHSHGCDAI